MESVRQSKVAKLLQKELAEIFRANAKTMFNNGFITVTIVRVSSDLSSAKIYLSIMATQDVDALFKSINEQKQHIRKKYIEQKHTTLSVLVDKNVLKLWASRLKLTVKQ